MNDAHDAASWGRQVRLITFGLGSAFVLVSIVVGASVDSFLGWLVPLELLSILVVAALFQVRGFEIAMDTLLIRRPFWKNRIPLAGLRAVEVDPDACKGAWKTIGNDGLFAMHGSFRSKRLGKFHAFITDPKKSVILRLADRIVVLSPADPAGFAAELNRRLGRCKESS